MATPTQKLSTGLAALIAAAALCGPAPSLADALPTSGFITAASRADIVFDTARSVLYISGNDSIQRYSLATQAFLDPIWLGGRTLGMDLSPDGNTLAVANTSRGATQNFVDLIDLNSGTANRAAFNLAFGEGGTYAVAYDSQGKLLVSSQYQGSGWTPLRKYDATTGTTISLGSVRQNTMLAASADRSVIAVAEANISNGPFGRYLSGSSSYRSDDSSGWFLHEVGVSRDGRQLALPTYGGTFFDDPDRVLPSVGTYAGQLPIGVAYSPVADVVYLPFAFTSYVAVYDTVTGAERQRLAVPGSFQWPGGAYVEGRTEVAADGSYLFVTLDNGVYFQALAAVPEPATWGSMLLGLALIAGLGARRRSRVHGEGERSRC